jgi:hypothetical protein
LNTLFCILEWNRQLGITRGRGKSQDDSVGRGKSQDDSVGRATRPYIGLTRNFGSIPDRV